MNPGNEDLDGKTDAKVHAKSDQNGGRIYGRNGQNNIIMAMAVAIATSS